MNISPKGEDYRRTTVCIDSYKNGVPAGRLYNHSLPDGKEFLGVTGFLLEMERALDEADFPKAFTKLRSFTIPPETRPDLPASEQRKGAISTFTVRILFRQNASWQGSVTWLEGKQEQSFRSALELIFLINSALEQEAIAS